MPYGTLTEVEYFYAGQVVKLKHPTGTYAMADNNFFTITKVNPKNLKVTQNSTGKPLQGSQTIFTAAPKEAVAAAPKAPEGPKIDWSQFQQGVVVKYVGKPPAKWNYNPDQKFFVLKHNFERVNIVRVGGDNGRYWRINPKNLEVIVPII